MSLENFDDMEVKELPVEGESVVADSSGDDGLETFDDDEVKEIDSEFSDNQVDQLEDDEGKEEESEKRKEEKPEAKEEEPKKEEEVKDEPVKPVGKLLKVKTPDGKTVEIDSAATFKVKVDGKNEIVTLDDLKSDYSGRVAYDKKFESLNVEKNQIQEELGNYKAEKSELTGHLQKIASILDDENANPLDALNYLVDMSGRDTLSYTQKVMNFLSEEVRTLDNMDDVERKLYWNEKQLENIRSNQAAKEERETQQRTQRENAERLNQLRESHGVTEEQFVESRSELSQLGYKSEEITPQAIVNYAVMKPHYEKAEQICNEHDDDLSTDQMNKLVTEVANTLKKNPSLSKDKALSTAVNILGWDMEEIEELENLNSRIPRQEESRKSGFSSSYAYGKSNKEDELDMFED